MGSWNPKQLNPCLQLPTKKASSFKLMGLKFARAVAPVLSSSPIMLSLYHHTNSSISQIPSPALLLTSFTASFAVNALTCMLAKLPKPLRDRFHHHRAAAKEKRSWPLPHYRSRLQQRCVDPTTWTLSSPTGQWHMVVVLLVQDYSYDYGSWESTRNSGSCFHSKGYMILSDAKIFYVKHRWESGCQANQQQSFRFLKGFISRQGMCSPTSRKLKVRLSSPGPGRGPPGAGGPGRHGCRGRGGRRQYSAQFSSKYNVLWMTLIVECRAVL